MSIRLALLTVSFVLLLSAPAIAYAQDTLDISLPVSYHINSTRAYDVNNTAISVSGDIGLLNSDTGLYAAIPTDAPDGTKLAFFQDTGTWTLFRNNTLLLPLSDGQDRVASLVLTTDDMACNNGTFYGQVTGIELDTKAIGDGDAMADAIVYLSKWPDRPTYKLSISDDAQIKNAVTNAAGKAGDAGRVKLMLNIDGDSAGYVIVRMKAPEAAGNVSAFLYRDGSVTKLTCKEIKANDSVVYETIYSGDGTFAFVGPFKVPPPVMASTRNLLIFAGGMALSLLLLVTATIKSLKWLAKKG